MDIPSGNSLVDPYSGLSGQPQYPWRGRITVDPAPGQTGSPDKSAAAGTQLASFLGQAAPGDFSLNGSTVVYSGPNEWSYRRMVLHYAYLCKAAGGVDAFLIGSELRGLTQLRDGQSSYPFVSALIQLTGEVKSVLGPLTKVTYAADWSEYYGHQPSDGSGEVYFISIRFGRQTILMRSGSTSTGRYQTGGREHRTRIICKGSFLLMS